MIPTDKEIKQAFECLGDKKKSDEYNNEFVVNVSCTKCKEWVTMRPKVDDVDSFTCTCGRTVKTFHMGTKLLKELPK